MRKISRTALLPKLLQFVLGLVIGYHSVSLYGGDEGLHVLVPPPAPHAAHQNSVPLFVGIMTATKFLSSRGCSAWRSWARDLVLMGGEVRFFTGRADAKLLRSHNVCDLPVLALPEVDDEAYPPQQKSFAMFRWMEEHVGSKALWFMRTDDDVFVRGEKLLNFLSGINRTELHFLGQAGRGRASEEGKLALEWNENFCMGGTGMLMSRPVLRLLAPRIDSCLANLMTSHEDVEVGRCVAFATGRPCTWAYEMQTLFYHSAGGADERGVEIDPHKANQRILSNALTIHPIKQPHNMEVLGLRLKSHRRLSLLSASQSLTFFNSSRCAMMNDSAVAADNLNALPPSAEPWSLIYNHYMYTVRAGGSGQRVKIPTHLYQAVLNVVATVLDSINADARERGRNIEYRDLYYAYVNEDPRYGLTYILDLLLVYKKFKGSKVTMKVRRHVFVRQPLLPPLVKLILPREELITPSVPALMPAGDSAAVATATLDETRRQTVTILVTVAGADKAAPLQRFLANFEAEVVTKMQSARLIMVIFRDLTTSNEGNTSIVEATSGPSVRLLAQEKAAYFENNYPGYAPRVIEKRGEFSRALGLTEGLKACQDSDLVFIVDIDIRFTSAVLDNVRKFSALGRAAYFPIVFSEFRDNCSGYWRDYGYGIMAAYKADIVRVGGFNTRIHGWGKEDVDLYSKFLKAGLAVQRTTEPGLVHVYHPVSCSPTLPADQAAMCNSSRANTFLPLTMLHQLVLNTTGLAP